MVGVTLDTNIYVSALEFGGINARLLGLARGGVFRIDISDAILVELVSVLRDDFNWDGYRLDFARDQIGKMANRVVPTQPIDAIKEDPDDNRILECALSAQARYIVSGDKHLLKLRTFHRIPILAPRAFLETWTSS